MTRRLGAPTSGAAGPGETPTRTLERPVRNGPTSIAKLKSNQKSVVTPSALISHATSLLQTGQPESALPTALRALALLQPDPNAPIPASLPALNLLGDIYLELGSASEARTSFTTAATLDPEGLIPEHLGGGVEKFLHLAQLSEEGGHESVEWFQHGADILRRQIGGSDGSDSATFEKRRRLLAETLCGIIEIYMTDLSWEPDAETRCESLITEALLTAPHSPEALQTLASVRISQTRIEEAQKALQSSMELWQDRPPESEDVPDFATRISLARSLMEVEMEENAIEVLERLVGEDDGSVEAWYLGGWCLYLLGTKSRHGGKQNHNDGEEENEWRTLMASSRDWLLNSLRLYDMAEYEDDRLRDHALELVEGLKVEVGDATVDDGDDGVEDEGWEDEESNDEDGDHDMNGT